MGIRLDMIGIVCRDMPASLAFYRQLGLEIPDAEPGEPYVEITLDGGIRLSWNDLEMVKSIDPGWTQLVGHRMGLAFLCSSAEEVDAKFAALCEAGYAGHKEPWDAFWGQRYAQISDPDGNLVDLFAWLPGQPS